MKRNGKEHCHNDSSMKNIRLTIAYDGTNYVGWQMQPNGVSIQSVVERAIEELTGSHARLLVAGRTDSGVHAIGQVANFETNSDIPIDAYRDGLQHHLPRDIVIHDAREVDPNFHATHSAKRKRYRYVIHNRRVPNPLVRNYAWHYRGKLDTDSMNEAAQVLLGTHDFRSFESHFPNKATSVRTVFEVAVYRTSGWPVWNNERLESDKRESIESHSVSEQASDAEFICFDIVADGFLYNMVRAIIGTLIQVGRREWDADNVRRIIDAQDRSQAGETAPPHGLYLVHVDYE